MNRPRHANGSLHRGRRRVGSTARKRAESRAAYGSELLGIGRPKEAEAAFLAALRDNPAHAGANHQLGLLALARGDFEAALGYLEGAVESAPSDPVVHNNLANLLVDSGRPEQAIAHYKKAIKLAPQGYSSAHYNYAKALQRLGRVGAAVRQFERVLALLPDDPQVLCGLGAALLEDGQAAQALARCELAVSLAPGMAEAHNNLGLVLLAGGEFDRAAEQFRLALDSDPSYTAAAANLTRTRRFGGLDDPDVERVQQLLRQPGLERGLESELRFALGKIFDDMGQFETAASHYRRGNELKNRECEFDPVRYGDYLESLLDTYQHWVQVQPVEPARRGDLPLFVVGLPRSGTSLVEQILASHPEVYGGGELPHIGQLQQRLQGDMMGAGGVQSLTPDAISQAAASYVDALTGRSDGSYLRVVDKTPTNFLYLGLIALMFPGARVIHCRRSVRDCALSIYFRLFTAGHDYAYDFGNIAAFLKSYERLMAGWERLELPIRMLTVNYEELVRDLETNARKIVSHAGLEWDANCLAFHRARRSVYTASTWQVRQPLYASSVGRWAHYANWLPEMLELPPSENSFPR